MPTTPVRSTQTHAGHPRDALPRFVAGEWIGKFELIRELGRGGMGQVFLARDTQLGRRVAIKFLLGSNPDLARRFIVEARATARCTHENIITIHEVHEHEGRPFMVLEYLEGRTLSQLLETKPSTRELTEILIPVVSALERAHEHGIVHRDLKPDNIFITNDGCVKVLDFGVAQLVEPNPDHTDDNWIVGTAPFMSPEQWTSGQVDHRSDLWQVGVVFWRALVGVHPAGTTSRDLLRARACDLDTPFPSIATQAPGLPRELVTIIDRCLEKRKEERYQHARELLVALRAVFHEGPHASDDECPYRGLAAYGLDDAQYFFGRTNEVRTARSMLESWPLLLVVGPSGVGKSSFVHAGIVPALDKAARAWQVHTIRPGRHPLLRLGAMIGMQADELARAPGTFGQRLREVAATGGARVLVVIDQLEELFTLGCGDDERQQFIAALAGAADDPMSPVRVVMSMRLDFLDRLAAQRERWHELSRGLMFLSPPDPAQLRELLTRPAEVQGYRFETPEIVDDLMQVASSRAALPLVSFVATQLWDARDPTHRVLTRASYREMGGVGGALARHADRVIAAMPGAMQRLARAMLIRLVTADKTRAVVELADLRTLGAKADLTAQVLDHLVAARLVQIHVDEERGSTAELVHEVLIHEWPTLARWLDDQQAIRGFILELQHAARQWQAHGRPADLLWHGATAEEAFAFERRYPLELSDDERSYLAAVHRKARRSRRRKLLAYASVVAVLALVIAGGGVALLRISEAEQEATQQARAAELAAQRSREARERADAEAARARAAEAERARKLEELQAARGEIARTGGQLEAKNAELEKTVETVTRERTRAQAAEQEATAAKERVEKLLAKERERVRALQREVDRIGRGGLR